MLGKTISHYRTIEKLGEGGMGAVYRAEDTALRRIVALKFLPPELTRDSRARERFIREAQAAAALNHPGICVVHEIAETNEGIFIAMECVEGKSLRAELESGSLRLDRALDITIQVAEALEEAHDRGVVHRDIKPGNIMITPKGRAKITDFGLARLSGSTLVTEAGTLLGTVAYMSPEQARGGAVDHRTDIWSLGVALYEMVSGRRPFRGDHPQAIIHSILNDDPPPMPSVPPALGGIILGALERDPGRRYQQASALAADLTAFRRDPRSVTLTVRQAPSDVQPSIAVMPFVNMSADPEQEYFCDGIAEEIINALTQVDGLRVIARTSAFAFKGKQEDVREIGRKLGVANLLEGSVRKAGDRLRVTAQLVAAADGSHLWSERYDRQLDDVFAIQDEITLAIVDKLRLKLLDGGEARLARRHTEDPEVHNLILQASFFLNRRRGSKDLSRATELLEEARRRDPENALVYAGLAGCWAIRPFIGAVLPSEVFPKARELATKALELDDSLAEAHMLLAHVKTEYEWDWVGAERGFRRAIDLNPSYATAHFSYSNLLMYLGRVEEAVSEIELARDLNPLSVPANRWHSMVLAIGRRYEEAARQSQRTIELDPTSAISHLILGWTYAMMSRREEALEEIRLGLELVTAWVSLHRSMIARTYVQLGMKDEARAILTEMLERERETYVEPGMIAAVASALGEVDLAFEHIEKAIEARDSSVLTIKTDRAFDSIRSDPRYGEVLRTLKLEG
jgi:TolB-like protein/Tfp pilus assembly protein PilF